MPKYAIMITSPSLTVLGDPIVCWTQIDVTLRFNEPSSGFFVVPAFKFITDQVVGGSRVMLMRDSTLLLAGPIEKWLHEQSDDGENSGVGRLTVHFADDLALVVARVTYPNPTLTPEQQTTDEWTYSGNAETALRNLVNLNAGPGALVARRVPMLALGPVASVGSSVNVVAKRMQPLGDVARDIAFVGGNLGFRTWQASGQILFGVYAPVNKAGVVRFSFGLGNLKYRSYEVTAPTATAVSVGGQGSGSDAAMIERVNASQQSQWGRFEKHVARPGSSSLQSLQEDGDQELGNSAAQTRLAANTSDVPDQVFGTHYNVGDIVSIEAWPGTVVNDIVRTVHLQVSATAGEYVSATVGSQAATIDPEWVKRLREIDERLGRVERTTTPAI